MSFEFVCTVQTGIMDDAVKVTLLGVWMALFVIFAGRKFSQPIKVYCFESYIVCGIFYNTICLYLCQM